MLSSVLALHLGVLWPLEVIANPQNPTVLQGPTPTFTTSGSQLTINVANNTAISWSSFNIAVGETTTFVQPSSTSLVWNQINDSNPSQILGNLNANGYVVLQNPNGFYVGGQAVIKANGLIMTTTPGAPPDLSSGGPWSFTLPPPSASIVNYGQINANAYLIAYSIDNEGSINAPGGSLGLYAGQTVLLSTRPDGRGLSAQVTIPEGTVLNNGQLVADGGLINLQAQVVNQNGLDQANTAQNINGSIELVAGGAVSLGKASNISAAGAATGDSDGGTVQISGGGSFTDKAGSTISVAGGAQGGNGGQLEIYGNSPIRVSSTVNGQAASGYQGGAITIGSANIEVTGTVLTWLNPIILNGGFYQVGLQADNDIQFDTAPSTATTPNVLTLYATTSPSLLSLTAGNNIIFQNKTGIAAALQDAKGNSVNDNYWNISLTAGLGLTSVANRKSGQDGVYLLGNSYLQTQDGNLNVWAANEVQINDGSTTWPAVSIQLINGTKVPNVLSSTVNNSALTQGMTTQNGGSVSVTTLYGDVNAGGDYNGYDFGLPMAPHYGVDSLLGGISTAYGGNVTINAGGNVVSFLPLSIQNWSNVAVHDGGSGAFGPEPGNVTIVAGGNISGNYVLANGVGSVTAQSGDIGSPTTASSGFAVNLIKGSWDVTAPNGSIYLQDARNPNGIFDDKISKLFPTAYHGFDYDPMASLSLQAGDMVEVTGMGVPHAAPSIPISTPIPFLFPPTLEVSAGSGGFVLEQNVILFPSAYGNLQITTQNGGPFQGNGFSLEMSDSSAKQYEPSTHVFLPTDLASSPLELNNSTPVVISISGDLDNVTLYTSKQTQLTVGGNAFNANLLAENLHSSDVTSVNVAGSIAFSPSFAFANLTAPISSVDPQVSSSWDTIFSLLVYPKLVAGMALNGNESLSTLDNDIQSLRVFPQTSSANAFNATTYSGAANPGFVYDSQNMQLAYKGRMSLTVFDELTGPLEIIQGDPHTGLPVLVKGQASKGQDPTKYYFATTTVSFVPDSVITTLYNESQNSASAANPAPGFQIGGPGAFKISAGSMDLGSSEGIISWGIGAVGGMGEQYANLLGVTPPEQGASINVNVGGNLTMLSSTIASVFGGNVTVNSGGDLTLSQGHFNLPQNSGDPSFGIYTAGHSDVSVTAGGDISIGNSRIGAFNGGNVFVESTGGNVDAGYGANTVLNMPDVFKNQDGQYVLGVMGGNFANGVNDPLPYGSGILAIAPTADFSWSTKPLPGNITIQTPKGNITSATGGIDQFALDGNISAGPTITLTAGTPASGHNPAIHGNIDLGAGGVIGGTVNLTAQGNITGLIVSHQNANIVAAQNVSATILSGGSANVSAVGAISGTVAGIGGVTASASSLAGASLLGQNVSANGATAQSTLGTTAAATSASQSAAQASTAEAQQEVASNDAGKEDDAKKKDKSRPVLSRRVGRVTVILPKAN